MKYAGGYYSRQIAPYYDQNTGILPQVIDVFGSGFPDWIVFLSDLADYVRSTAVP